MDAVIKRGEEEREKVSERGTEYGAEVGSAAFIQHQREEAMAALLLARDGKTASSTS